MPGARALLVALALAAISCGAPGGGAGGAKGAAPTSPRVTKPINTGAIANTAAPEGPPVPAGEIDSFETIPTEAHWKALVARPSSEHLSNTEVVKFIIDRADGKAYFLQTERWPIHFDFAKKFLSTEARPVEDHGTFNKREYHDPNRRFYLGTIARYVDARVWSFELLPSDEMDLAVAAQVFQDIKKRVFFGGEMRFRPVSAAHEREIERARALMPVVMSDELFGKVRYQPLELGGSYGYLRLIARADGAKIAGLTQRDIVVLEELPEEVPVVAGVISDQIQAPLGHINVLCHNRKTPNMALRGALSDPRVAPFKDKLVHFVVDGQSFNIEAATEADAERAWEAQAPKDILSPKRDDRDVGLPLLTDFWARDATIAGAKASQLALITKSLPPGATPRAFVLPFHAYARFMAANGFDKRVKALLASPAIINDPAKRREELASLRSAMESAPVPADILRPFMARMKYALPPGVVRLRSSTNAEDLPGFNGAGLYRSMKIKDPTNVEEATKALRQVWSSVWLPGAFEERQFYHIDHNLVGMAILVQESIDDITANGVAITANPFNQGQPAYFINAQIAAGSVTGARGDEVPEQILYYTFEGGEGVERLSRSSLSKDRDILSPGQVEELAHHLAQIHLTLGGSLTNIGPRAVDVEFLVQKSGRVIIVQARPYTMEWNGDRRWRVTFD